MNYLSVPPPFPVFEDADGTALKSGFVFVGEENKDPESDPITVFWDADLTQPAAQPIRTNNGFLSRTGSPARVYTNENYSITVKDKKEVVVYTSLADNTEAEATSLVFIDVAEMRAFAGTRLFDNQSVTLIGGALPGDGAGGDFFWDSTSVASEDSTISSVGTVVKLTNTVTGRFVRTDQTRPTVKWFGAKGDWNGATGTDDLAAFDDADAYMGKDGGQLDLPEGRYKLSAVKTFHNGIVLNGLGTVGSVRQKGVKIICDHDGDGIIFDGNNGVSSTEGAEEQIRNIWILKGPNRNGGDGLSFISTGDNNTPGFVYCTNVHVLGSSTSVGEGLWSRGWVIDGSQATIGLKNVHLVGCGVSGISTANKYLDVLNLIEAVFDDFYVRDASASFPSAGATGITIDSTQVGGDPAINNPSSHMKFANSSILGDIKIGEVAKLHFTNCFAVGLEPTGVPGSGTNVAWAGGELTEKYVDATGYLARIDCLNQTSDSDLSNQFRTAAALNLEKAHSGIVITHPDAAGAITHTLPNVKTTSVFDFTIKSNGGFDVQIDLNASGANSFFPRGANANGNITDVVIPDGSTARFRSNGDASDGRVLVDVVKGLVTLTGLGDTGTMSETGHVVRISALSGNLLTRPREATHFILDGGASNRNFSLAIATFDAGDEVAITNNGSTNTINFDELVTATYTAVIATGTTEKFIFDGAIFSKIS